MSYTDDRPTESTPAPWTGVSSPQIWDGDMGVVGKSVGSWVSLGTVAGWTKSDCIIEVWQITDWTTFGSVTDIRLENRAANTTSPAAAVRALQARADGSGSNRFAVWVIADDTVAASSLTLDDPGSTWTKEIWDVYQTNPDTGGTPIGRVYRAARTTNGDRAVLDQWFYSASYAPITSSSQLVWLRKNTSAAYTQAGLESFRDSVQSTGNWKVHAPGYQFRRYT